VLLSTKYYFAREKSGRGGCQKLTYYDPRCLSTLSSFFHSSDPLSFIRRNIKFNSDDITSYCVYPYCCYEVLRTTVLSTINNFSVLSVPLRSTTFYFIFHFLPRQLRTRKTVEEAAASKGLFSPSIEFHSLKISLIFIVLGRKREAGDRTDRK
jgi:hypothetical protein